MVTFYPESPKPRAFQGSTRRTIGMDFGLSQADFSIHKGEYRLKTDMNKEYCKVFFDALIPYKNDIFKYVQQYYRCFMNKGLPEQYPQFKI